MEREWQYINEWDAKKLVVIRYASYNLIFSDSKQHKIPITILAAQILNNLFGNNECDNEKKEDIILFSKDISRAMEIIIHWKLFCSCNLVVICKNNFNFILPFNKVHSMDVLLFHFVVVAQFNFNFLFNFFFV